MSGVTVEEIEGEMLRLLRQMEPPAAEWWRRDCERRYERLRSMLTERLVVASRVTS